MTDNHMRIYTYIKEVGAGGGGGRGGGWGWGVGEAGPFFLRT